jgi:GNAT superfamily N-acetyltransferase
MWQSSPHRVHRSYRPLPSNARDAAVAADAADAETTGVNPAGIRIRATGDEPRLAAALAEVLIDCVEGGASVSFMSPLPHHRALAFWQGVIDSARRGERIVLVAEEADSGIIVGTVQLLLAMPDNQPHRADVAKMLVHRRARRRGLGAALMQAAETAARAAGRTLLVLDTVTGGDAERLYTRQGWQRVGVIPGYALWPDGGLCDTTYFYKTLTAAKP